jgi:hypothetical protein
MVRHLIQQNSWSHLASLINIHDLQLVVLLYHPLDVLARQIM